jgi:hypothetical protein
MFSVLRPNPNYAPGNCENFWVCASSSEASQSASYPNLLSSDNLSSSPNLSSAHNLSSFKKSHTMNLSSPKLPGFGLLPASPKLNWRLSSSSVSPKYGLPAPSTNPIPATSSSSVSLPSSPRLWRSAVMRCDAGRPASPAATPAASPMPSRHPAGISILGRHEAYRYREVAVLINPATN